MRQTPYIVTAQARDTIKEVVITRDAQQAADDAIHALILMREARKFGESEEVSRCQRLMIQNLTALSRLVGGLGCRNSARALALQISTWDADTGTAKGSAYIRPVRTVEDIPTGGSCLWCGRYYTDHPSHMRHPVHVDRSHYVRTCLRKARQELADQAERHGRELTRQEREALVTLEAQADAQDAELATQGLKRVAG